MTVITDKNVAYFIIRNVTHSETSINETAEKKKPTPTLKRQMIKCLLTEFGRAERENVWGSIRAS